MKQLVAFFIIAYLLSWILWLPLYGSTLGLSLPDIPLNHGIGTLGPLLAAIILTGYYRGKEGLSALWKQCTRIKPLFVLVALASPLLIAMIASLVYSLNSGTPVNWTGFLTTKEFPGINIVVFFCYNLFFFGFGEETGWRGFALPRLQEKMHPLLASIVLTVFWALWHLPLFFYRPGYIDMGPGAITGWFFSLLTGSILLTWLYNNSGRSILVCAVFHTTIDLAFTTDFTNPQIVNYTGFLITLWGIATLFMLLRKEKVVKAV